MFLTTGGLELGARIFLTSTMLACFMFERLYGFSNLIFLEEFMCVLKAGVMILIITILYMFAGIPAVSALSLTIGTIIFLCCTLAARYSFRSFLFSRNILTKSVLIVGAGRTGKSFVENVISSPFTLRRAAGFIDDDPAKQGSVILGVPVLGNMEEFARIQEKVHADEAVIAITALPEDELSELFDVIGKTAGKVLAVPEVFALTTPTSTAHDGGLAPSENLQNPVSIFIKSAIDYFGAVVALIIFSPLMLWAAWRIKREDGGSIFFIQERVGYKTLPFRVCKFRTMYMDAEERTRELFKDKEIYESYKQGIKLKDDPRVTKIGHILRKTSIDELPQLFNVLRGEMSLVGPRPLMKSDVDIAYGAYAGRRIYSVKPGMTGLWQVSGRSEIDTDIRKELNLYYAHNWSVWLDIVILLKTPIAVIMKRGAY